jgi:hypothetical protein
LIDDASGARPHPRPDRTRQYRIDANARSILRGQRLG